MVVVVREMVLGEGVVDRETDIDVVSSSLFFVKRSNNKERERATERGLEVEVRFCLCLRTSCIARTLFSWIMTIITLK
jgi:hypothetical protein